MVRSFLGLLRGRYEGKLGADADQYIGFAVEGAERMERLISDLLAFSRVGGRGGPFLSASLDADPGRGAAQPSTQDQKRRGKSHPRCPADAGSGRDANVAGVPEPHRQRDQVPRRGTPAGNPRRRSTGAGPLGLLDSGTTGWASNRSTERIFQVFQRLHTREQVPRLGHRPGDLQKDHRAARRRDLDGIPAGARYNIPLYDSGPRHGKGRRTRHLKVGRKKRTLNIELSTLNVQRAVLSRA